MFSIRGILRGTVAQVFAFFGLMLGLWLAALVADRVGIRWHDARPAFVFLVLRWVVAVLAGLAVASLFQWWGDGIAKATHQGPFGWLDRLVGGVVGLAFGFVAAALIALAAVESPWLGVVRGAAIDARGSAPLIVAGARITGGAGAVPGGLWLHEQFVRASRHLPARRAV